MGNYVFGGEVLIGELKRDATDTASEHDFGRDILPQMVRTHAIYAYDFETNLIAGETARNRGYWRDVGTIETYYDANMDLRTIEPALNLYNHLWPLHTAEYHEGPTKYTFNEEGRQGGAIDSVICEGSILAGGRVIDSVLGRRVRVEDRAQVKESVVMDNCRIGAGARIRRAIIDKNAVIPDGERIGYDLEKDRQKYFVSETGIVVVEGRRSPDSALAHHNLGVFSAAAARRSAGRGCAILAISVKSRRLKSAGARSWRSRNLGRTSTLGVPGRFHFSGGGLGRRTR